MAAKRSIFARIDRVCAWLFVVPFFLMMLIPASVMPTRGADGQMMLVICTGDGPVTLDAGSTTPEVRVKCDWAMGHADVTATDAPVIARGVVYAGTLPATAVSLWRPAHDTRSVTARGPPTLF